MNNNVLDNATVFDTIKEAVLNFDPVYFCEKHLTLDGKPFKLRGNGYKPFVDMYRHIGIKALDRSSKPIIFLKGRQVGATTMAANLEMYWMGCGAFGNNGRPPMRVMHCFPQLDIAAAYTKIKLNAAISQAVRTNETPKPGKRLKSYMENLISQNVNESLQYKEFQNGNHIWVESTGVDASRLRGRTVDSIIFDEIQDMPVAALSNAIKMMTMSQYGQSPGGVQVYMGTPKNRDSEYYNMWMKSSQQIFHLKCEHCKEYFPLYVPGSDSWEKIWLYKYTVKCPHCSHLQDKRDATERGKWIGLDEDQCELIGYHINQLYMPNFTREKIESEKPGIHPINTERAWMNEVLGEFYTGQGLGITADQIREFCGDIGRKMRKRILPSENKLVFMGADWGKRADADVADSKAKKQQQGQSYSTIVVMSVEGPDRFEIQFAHKLQKNDLQYKLDIVDQVYMNYNVTIGVGDIGYAGDLSQLLQAKYDKKFLASEAAGGRLLKKIKFNEHIFPKTIVFDRNYYIEEMFTLMKKGAFRFPMGSFEHVAWLVNHCSSMEVKITRDRSNSARFTYVKGLTPNDGFMALLNAYLAYKFYISKGFKNTNLLFGREQPSTAKMQAIPVFLPNVKTFGSS